MRVMKRTARAGAAITRLLTSNRFFYFTIGFFVLQAVWLACTALYPMAYDESYHFGLIQQHVNQWMPFFTHQPAGIGGGYGPVTRDPSYLYHYLMSLPYRLIDIFHPPFMALVISLRLIDVALFVLNFVLFRRLLLRLGASRPLAHSVLFAFSLIPVVPFLAAHINYDNLFITLMLAALLLTFSLVDGIRERRISAPALLGFVSVIAAGSIVKYPFLPIAAALVVVLATYAWLQRHDWRQLLASISTSFRRLSMPLRVALVTLTLVTAGLFGERYIINLWQYHSLSPDCSAVLDVDSCLAYGPWARNYTYAQTLPSGFTPNILHYPLDWIQGMWTRSFFAINNNFVEVPPLPIPSWGAAAIGIAGTLLLIPFGWRLLRGNRYRVVVLFVFVLYTGALFVQTLAGYITTAHLVAINGRYLIPFMPFMFLFVGLAFAYLFQRLPKAKPYAVLVVFLLLLQGGGAMTFILRSDPSWDWQNTITINANDTVRNVLAPIIIGSRS